MKNKQWIAVTPFWRGTNKRRGINMKKFFLQPRDLDIVLWAHGSAAVPYLETGDVTDEVTWNRFQRAYRGQFFNFAAWIN